MVKVFLIALSLAFILILITLSACSLSSGKWHEGQGIRIRETAMGLDIEALTK